MYLIGIAGGSGSGKTTFANKIINHLTYMQNQLQPGEKYDLMVKYIGDAQDILDEFDKPAALRNDYRIKREIELLGKRMRQNFKADQVKLNLK